MSPTERNYSNIECKMLAVIVGLEKFHTFTYTRKVYVITDHKPLLAFGKKPICEAPPRMQRLLLRSKRYDYTLLYRPGKKQAIFDALSRLSTHEEKMESTHPNMDLEVDTVIQNDIGYDNVLLKQLFIETRQDLVL